MRTPAVCCAIALALQMASPATAQTEKPKRVLVFTQVFVSRPSSIGILQAMQAVFNARMPTQVEILPEYVGDDLSELNWLVPKYAGRQFDLIVCLSRAPHAVALEYREKFAPNTPILMVVAGSTLRTQPSRKPNVAVLHADLRIFDSVRTTLAVLPETRFLAYVGGATPDDIQANRLWMAKIHELWPQLGLIDLNNLSLAELKHRVASLPDQTICFLGNFDADAAGYYLSKAALAAALAPHSNAPLFDHGDVAFGSGTLGGWISSIGFIGRDIGTLSVRILQGEPVDTIPVVQSIPGAYRFDSRQLNRWKIDKKRLPPGSSIEFVEPTVWDRYWNWLLFALGAVATLLGLILFLFLDRRRREKSFSELRQKARFDAILGQTVLSINQSARPADSIQAMLQSLREHIQADVTALTAVRMSGDQIMRQGFTSPETLPGPDPAKCPYIAQELYAGRTVLVTAMEDFPSAATVDRASMEEFGFAACFGVPLLVDGQFAGAFLAANYKPREWPESLVSRVRQVGESVVAAWGHHLAAGESLSQSILNSFAGYVVAVDRHGRVLDTKGTVTNLQPCEPGVSYEHIWKGLPVEIAKIEESLRLVRTGERPTANEELRYEYAGEERWVQIHMQQLQHPLGGAVITHLDVSEGKRLELAAAHQINQIAHWNRVSAMGELAASLAHEVNQPLSAILANAEVVKVMLESSNPDLPEVKEIVTDLQNDGARAAAVISGMRSLLKKNPAVTVSELDVAEVIRETVRLINGDAARRNVRLELDLAANTGSAIIDRTQLQQVLLNLFNNALDAAETSETRWISVRSYAQDGRAVVEVEDSGHGIAANDRERIFEPFFTTKPDGLGVGLAISRSIISAAGGTVIALQTDNGAGATLRVMLPSA